MIQPPRILLWLVDAICPANRPDLKGDMLELYQHRQDARGRANANLGLMVDVVTSIPLPWIIKQNVQRLSPKAMLKTNLKIAGRNLVRNKLYTAINVFGLSASLAACLLITFFIRDEISFDKHFKDHEKIYRVAGNYVQSGDTRVASANTTYMLLPLIEDKVTGAQHFARADFRWEKMTVNETQRFEQLVAFADSTFLDVFSLPFLYGDPSTALDDPAGAVIDERTAIAFYGTSAAVGKVFTLNEKTFTVQAVMENIPENSHFTASLILPMSGVRQWYPDWVLHNISGRSLVTYVKAGQGFDQKEIEEQVNKILKTNWPGDQAPELFLQAIDDIHLGQPMHGELKITGTKKDILIFSLTAAIILFLACINYINLSMAAAIPRSKEAGVKRVLGATVRMVVAQFQVESTLILFVSALFACGLAWAGMPLLNEMTGKSLVFNVLNDPLIIVGLVAVVVLIGPLAGSIPAFTLVRTGTIGMLAGKLEFKQRRFKFSDTLIVFQFTIAIGLMASTLIIMDQIRFIRNKDIGVNPNQVLFVPMTYGNAQKYEVLKTELSTLPFVKHVTASTNRVAGGIFGWRSYAVKTGQDPVNIPTVSVAHDFFETMEAVMLDGRSFSRDFPADSAKSYVINEAAAKLLELKEPVGTFMFGMAFNGNKWAEMNANIIGVVKDFHFSSLHTNVEPVVFSLSSSMTTPLNWMEVRIAGNNIKEETEAMSKVWTKLIDEDPFQFSFMNDELQRYYVAEDHFMKLFVSFSVLSLLIGTLGLFGLTAFMTKRRTKEIGIRKVIGASTTALIALVSRDFLKLVLIGILVGGPIAWYFMDRWLQNFAFQTTITLVTFLITGLGAMLVAFVAILYHSLLVSRANPVKALRTE